MNSKILTLDQLAKRAAKLRAEGRRIVATNGCFDLLHVGHVRYLQAASALGDVLVVGINGDASVRALKGSDRPVNSESDRAEIIAALACVNFVAVFPEVRASRFLEVAQPSVYVKGGDYKPETLNPEERVVLDRIGARIEIVPFAPGYSTSSLLARVGGD